MIPEESGELVGDRRNMVFKGTAVVYGRARGIVVGTGMDTALGQIAGLLQAHQAPRTPLQTPLAVLGRWLAAAAVIIAVVVFAVGIARGEDTEEMFLVAVSLAVAAIPEALPAVVTIGLAMGAQRMIRHNALIRKLPAVETLGSVTVICTDKTGTLTEGRMLVEKVWTTSQEGDVTGSGYEPSGEITVDGHRPTSSSGTPLAELLTAAALCNDAVLVPPTEAAASGLWSATRPKVRCWRWRPRPGSTRNGSTPEYPRTAEIPFDSERKRMVTIHRTGNGERRLWWRPRGPSRPPSSRSSRSPLGTGERRPDPGIASRSTRPGRRVCRRGLPGLGASPGGPSPTASWATCSSRSRISCSTGWRPWPIRPGPSRTPPSRRAAPPGSPRS